VDGKVLRGSYQLETDNPNSESHPAIMLVSAYLVERGLILEPYEVDAKTNEITALPEFIKTLGLKGWCLPLMPLVPKKTCQVIIDSGNHYIGALKGNQGLLEQVQENFIPLERVKDICKGMVGLKTYIKHLSDA